MRAQVQTCDLERELNGGNESPHAVEASAKAAAAWKVLLGRLARHNSTAKFMNSVEPALPPPVEQASGAEGVGAAAAAARGGHVRLGGVEVQPNGEVRDKVLESLNDALKKLGNDESAEKELHAIVDSGRHRLAGLHLELG
jgi:hypothetical protein